MCGIAGTVDYDESRGRGRVVRLNGLQRHRGPDHTALATVGPFTLGNTRLAIQDLSGGANQPLVSDDGRYICVFNGEIYNFRELRSRFSLAVRSDSDGAVLPPLWALMGVKFSLSAPRHVAIAVIDSTLGTLTLARDPFGIKPLYVRTFQDGSVAFASEFAFSLVSALSRSSILQHSPATYGLGRWLPMQVHVSAWLR